MIKRNRRRPAAVTGVLIRTRDRRRRRGHSPPPTPFTTLRDFLFFFSSPPPSYFSLSLSLRYKIRFSILAVTVRLCTCTYIYIYMLFCFSSPLNPRAIRAFLAKRPQRRRKGGDARVNPRPGRRHDVINQTVALLTAAVRFFRRPKRRFRRRISIFGSPPDARVSFSVRPTPRRSPRPRVLLSVEVEIFCKFYPDFYYYYFFFMPKIRSLFSLCSCQKYMLSTIEN